MQAYSDPKRENDPHALPDLEIFHAKVGEWAYDAYGERCDVERDGKGEATNLLNEAGWYWWVHSPGCLPDSEPNGPFETSDEALKVARAYHGVE
jgi:hypothetical protein